MSKEVRTTCPLDCPCACGLSVSVEQGRAVAIRKPHGSEVNPCLKGVGAIERVYHPDRLKHPLLKKDGSWDRISWDDALDILASKIKGAVNEYGPNSIFYWAYNSGTLSFMRRTPERFLNALGGVTVTNGSVCEDAGLEGLRQVTGLNWSVHQPKDWENSRYIIIWGKDIKVTWPPYYKHIAQAKKNGAKMVVIDPVKSRTAMEADVWIPLRPGTDMALALAMVNVIVKEGLHDYQSVQQSTKDFDKLQAFIKKYTPEWAEGICEVKARTIRELAREYATVKPASIHPGVGAQHNTWGYDAMRAISYLVALTGNFGIRGGGLNYYGGSIYFPFNRTALDLGSMGKSRIDIPTAKLAEHILAKKPAECRIFLVAGGNPVDMAGDTEKTVSALKTVDFVVVMEQFMSSTAKLADLVLPAAHYLEFDDIIPSWGHTLIQPVRKAIDPPPEARSEWDVFSDLAKRMGLGDHFSRSFLEILDEVLVPAGTTVKEVVERGAVSAPQPLIPFEDGAFPTKSGKFEFYSEAMAGMGLDSWPEYKVPPEGVGSSYERLYPLSMITRREYGLLNSQYANVPKFHGANGAPRLTIHPADADARRIKDGELVEVYNHHGSCQLKAEVSEDTSRGVVVTYIGWWKDVNQKGGANCLTSDRYAILGTNSILKEAMVEVRHFQ